MFCLKVPHEVCLAQVRKRVLEKPTSKSPSNLTITKTITKHLIYYIYISIIYIYLYIDIYVNISIQLDISIFGRVSVFVASYRRRWFGYRVTCCTRISDVCRSLKIRVKNVLFLTFNRTDRFFTKMKLPCPFRKLERKCLWSKHFSLWIFFEICAVIETDNRTIFH